jgi:hypothetical protein
MALLPLRRKLSYGFVSSLKNPSLSSGSEPANRGFNGKHDNRYTNEKVWHYV